jgi:hypothetical protein
MSTSDDLTWFGQSLDEVMPRLGVHTLAFFAFWVAACASSALTRCLAWVRTN